MVGLFLQQCVHFIGELTSLPTRPKSHIDSRCLTTPAPGPLLPRLAMRAWPQPADHRGTQGQSSIPSLSSILLATLHQTILSFKPRPHSNNSTRIGVPICQKPHDTRTRHNSNMSGTHQFNDPPASQACKRFEPLSWTARQLSVSRPSPAPLHNSNIDFG